MVRLEAGQRVLDDLLGALYGRRVGTHDEHAALTCDGLYSLDSSRYTFGCAVRDVVEHDAGASLGQSHGDARPDAVLFARARDDGHLAGEREDVRLGSHFGEVWEIGFWFGVEAAKV